MSQFISVSPESSIVPDIQLVLKCLLIRLPTTDSTDNTAVQEAVATSAKTTLRGGE